MSPDDLLSRAVVAYVGFDTKSWPHHLPEAVAPVVGEADAPRFITRIDHLLAEAWSIGWPPQGRLIEDTQRVESTMRASHPDLTDDAVRAIAWSYSFNAK